MNIDIATNDTACPTTSSDVCENYEILFLDTFTTQNEYDNDFDDTARDYNSGLVQFSKPVIIHEIRIVPLSTVISSKNIRPTLSSTFPSSFEINFYLNDLKAKESATFLHLGRFPYNEHNTSIFKPDILVATDGLFIKGNFQSITLAVIGIATEVSDLIKNDELSTEHNLSSVESFKEHDDELHSTKSSLKDVFDDSNSSLRFHDKKEAEEASVLSSNSGSIGRSRLQRPERSESVITSPKSGSSVYSQSLSYKSKDKSSGKYLGQHRTSSSGSNSISPKSRGSNRSRKLDPSRVQSIYDSQAVDVVTPTTGDSRESRRESSHHRIRSRYDENEGRSSYRSRSRGGHGRSPTRRNEYWSPSSSSAHSRNHYYQHRSYRSRSRESATSSSYHRHQRSLERRDQSHHSSSSRAGSSRHHGRRSNSRHGSRQEKRNQSPSQNNDKPSNLSSNKDRAYFEERRDGDPNESSRKREALYKLPSNDLYSPISVATGNAKQTKLDSASPISPATLSSPVSPNDDDFLIKDINFSPIGISSQSSVSNVSLKSHEPTTTGQAANAIDNAGNDKIGGNHPVGPPLSLTTNQAELFEAVSDSSDLLDAAPFNEQEDFDQISTSSELESPMEPSKVIGDEGDVAFEDQNGKLLEVISSDEEYGDIEVNSSDKMDNSKNLFEDINDDDDMDTCFDSDASDLFDPFATNQLETLKFPFISNSTSAFIDVKLFSTILNFVEEHFGQYYVVGDGNDDEGEPKTTDFINETWVENVECLAMEIMKLSSPIYGKVTCDADTGGDNEDANTTESQLETLVSILISITKDGLNLDRARQQPQTYIGRHLKAGIKLFAAMFSSLDLRFPGRQQAKDSSHMLSMLFEADLPYHLLRLYSQPFMTLSIRLMILNGLIVTCDYSQGVEYLCNRTLEWSANVANPANNNDEDNLPLRELPTQMTSYQHLLTLIACPYNRTRLTSVFEELLDKINLYHILKAVHGGEATGQSYGESLQRMITVFDRLSNRVHRPIRLLPVIYQYEVKTSVHASLPLLLLSSSLLSTSSHPPNEASNIVDETFNLRFSCRHVDCSSSACGYFAQKCLYRFAAQFNFLQTIVTLLEHVNKSLVNGNDNNTEGDGQNEFIDLGAIGLALLKQIISSQHGMKFLLQDEQNLALAHRIHQLLVQAKDIEIESTQFARIKLRREMLNFGITFITRLYTLNMIDTILWNAHQDYQANKSGADMASNFTSSVLAHLSRNENWSSIRCLYRLYTMISFDKAALRKIVVSVLTLDHNFDAILAFILPITSTIESVPALERTTMYSQLAFIYASNIALACVHYIPESCLLHFFDTYGRKLLKNVANADNYQTMYKATLSSNTGRPHIFKDHIVRFASLDDWMTPIKSGDGLYQHDEQTIRMYVSILKKHNDLFRDKFNKIDNPIHRVFHLEPEVLSALKFLVALCDPSTDWARNRQPEIQSKYKYSLLHCYSYDCMSYLLTLLEGITETCVRPSHQIWMHTIDDSYHLFDKFILTKTPNAEGSAAAAAAAGDSHSNSPKPEHKHSLLDQESLIIEFLQSSMRLLKLMLNLLVSSKGAGFADCTPVPILLRTYTLLNFVRSSPVASDRLARWQHSIGAAAEAVQAEVIEILLSVYVRAYLEHLPPTTDDRLAKTNWTKTLKHLLAFTMEAPQNFAAGLQILNQLLPLPLPVRCQQKLETITMVGERLLNFRKLWAGHILCAKTEFAEMLHTLLMSDASTIQLELRDVCYKLGHLYTPVVVFLARSLTEALLHNINYALRLRSEANKKNNAGGGEGAGTSASSAGLSSSAKGDRTFDQHSLHTCVRLLNLVLDLFARCVPFRVAILHALYYFGNADLGRKNVSKVYQLVSRLFDYLDRVKLEKDISPTAVELLENVLTNGQAVAEVASKAESLETLLDIYFKDNNSPISLEKGEFTFPEKLAAKFVAASSEALNHYFKHRSLFLGEHGAGEDDEHTEQENQQANFEDTKIYSVEFVTISSNHTYPVEWSRARIAESLKVATCTAKMDFIAVHGKYFASDPERLDSIVRTLHSTIVELPEPEDKSREDNSVAKMLAMPVVATKRNPPKTRGRSYNRSDMFRSRAPNTSRPPSMHVDVFEELASAKNRSSSHHHHSMSIHMGGSSLVSSYRKKVHNHHSHHSPQPPPPPPQLSLHSNSHGHHHHQPSTPYSNYSLKPSLLGNIRNNNGGGGGNTGSNNSGHYRKQ